MSSIEILVEAFLANPNSKIIQLNITLTKPANELYKVEISSIKDENDEYCRHLHDCSSNYINSVSFGILREFYDKTLYLTV